MPIGLKYRTSAYEAGVFDCFFFEKNLQGDIIAVYNSAGKKIGSYTYDAWGNVTCKQSSGITKDVDIDYDGDERFYVRAGAKALEILGWD